MANSYKALKEDFVSNLSGGSIGEINVVTAIAPASVLLWSVLQARHGFFDQPTFAAQLTDFIINVGCILFGTTVYSSSSLALVAVLLASSLAYAVLPAKQPAAKPVKRPTKSKQDAAQEDTKLSGFPLRPFITAYRGTMLVVTCTSILAVDFPVFPRRFAKVETWGTSLMDLGVGSFVFSAGVVAARPVLQQRQSNRQVSLAARILGSLRAALPLIALGGLRLLSVKNLDYAEHVSEYGVHWNFFFTMAVVPLSLAFLQPLIELLPGPRYAIAGLVISLVHQVALSTGLQSWALTAPRVDILSQNREGITSSIGYLAIFILGMSAGTLVMARTPDSSALYSKTLDVLGLGVPKQAQWAAAQDRHRVRLITSLSLASVTYGGLLVLHRVPHLLPGLTVGVSRRMANAPYVLWIAAFNCMQIAAFCLIETTLFPAVRRARSPEAERTEVRRATSRILDTYNSGGLLLFLVANLGTGAVNMGIDTLHTSDTLAVVILTIYMAVLTVVCFSLRGIKLKI